MKIGVAQYGMTMWYGGLFDLEERLAGIRSAGYEGTETAAAVSPADALHKSALYRRLGMDFAVCNGPDPQSTLLWTAALGKAYIHVAVSSDSFDTFCERANRQADSCKRWGLRPSLHNHLDTPVETESQIADFLDRCPGCGLILDTAHLALADGDNVAIVKKYCDRIEGLHVKDWFVTNPEIGREMWIDRGRFCELGAGNIGMDNAAVMRALADGGYNRWVFVEQDTHLQDPLKDLAISRQFLRDAGF